MHVRIFTILLLAVGSAATIANAQTAAPCLKAWTIPDKWIDRHDDPDDGGLITFETVDSHGNALSDPDLYIGPWGPDYTGFRVETDLGRPITLRISEPQDGMKSGWFYSIDLGTTGGGAEAYRTAIATCQDTRVFIGDELQPLSGKLAGPTVQGIADLINLDPEATWDREKHAIVDSCAPSASCGLVSPRVVAIPVFDPARFEWSLINSGRPQLVITNFIGVFIDGVVGGQVTGYITLLSAAR